MKKGVLIWFLLGFCSLWADPVSSVLLSTTEADPDAFVEGCCNVLNGEYCESTTDLILHGPDLLPLQRFYTNKNYHTGEGQGGWRILPQCYLVLGQDPKGKKCKIGGEEFGWVYAYTGERSGGILTYSGWKKKGGDIKDLLCIQAIADGIGMVNSYSGEMNGQTNHLNNRIDCTGNTITLTLGDGTKRIYERVSEVPTELFGEELLPVLANRVVSPEYFHLVSEILPSGNTIYFAYDEEGHLASIESRDCEGEKVHSWINFSYEFGSEGASVFVTTSEGKTLLYEFAKISSKNSSMYLLKEVTGSHLRPISYEYAEEGNQFFLTRKNLPEGRFVGVEYDRHGRVERLQVPHAESGDPTPLLCFTYGKGFTDVTNIGGQKTRYHYDASLQLTKMELFDEKGGLYRIDQKMYGKTRRDVTQLVARSVSNGLGEVLSFRAFHYDDRGNILEEKLYGNLTGGSDKSLEVDGKGFLTQPDEEECHVKTFTYSDDGYNLLTSLGDAKGNKTTFAYEKQSNRLRRKLIYEREYVRKREFRFYNNDGACTQILEDDGTRDEISNHVAPNRRRTKKFQPKEELPGVGLPLIIEGYYYDRVKGEDSLIKKLVNTFSYEGDLLSCETYDANGEAAYITHKTYDCYGQTLSETNPEGRTVFYSYDGVGNRISLTATHLNKTVETRFDFRNQPIEIVEKAGELQAIQQFSYDSLGRKVTETDRFGQTTHFVYDSFDRITQVIHPQVLDEHETPVTPTFSYTYNIFGNVLTTVDPKGYVTEKQYNLRGDPTKIYYPDGTFELFKYDPEGSLHRTCTRDQRITVIEYDYLGRVVHEEISTAEKDGVGDYLKTRRYVYEVFDLVKKEDGLRHTQFINDYAGKIEIKVEYCDRGNGRGWGKTEETRRTEFLYDSLGREYGKKIWFDVGPNDYSFECQEYDLLGNIVEKRIEDASGNILLLKSFLFDEAGRCILEKTVRDEQDLELLRTTYDPFGEPICFEDSLGNKTEILLDYGKEVLEKTVVNPLGMQTIYTFDALGRMSALVKKDSQGRLLAEQKMFYDSVGNKAVERHAVLVNGKQVGVQQTRWVYGPSGRLEELIEGDGSSEERTTSYRYDSKGKLEQKFLPGISDPLVYFCSDSGKIAALEYTEGKKELLKNWLSYDTFGNCTYATTKDRKIISREYDVFNQVVEERVDDGGTLYTLQFQYDRKGRIKKITLPDSSSIAYVYDAAFGREVKRISANGEELYVHSYNSYDLSGKISEETLIGYGEDCEWEYDLAGQVVARRTFFYNEQVPEGGYNSCGALLEVERTGEFPVESTRYEYNGLSQLTFEKNGGESTFSYDSVENRLTKDGDELSYNALNQLRSSSCGEYTYDAQGNLISIVEGEREKTFTWNVVSQLVSVTNADGENILYSYDGFGRKLIKESAHKKERSFYLGNHELGTLDEKGNIQRLRIPGISGDTLSQKSVAFEIDGEVYGVIHDLAGNVVALFDPYMREVVESYAYTAYGQEKIFNFLQEEVPLSEVGNLWRFAEKPIDEALGFIDFGFRYYDPFHGRWISCDPTGYQEGPNLYSYCKNSPLNAFDRFGLEAERDSSEFEGYFYGEVEPHCFCESHRTCKRGGDLKSTLRIRLPSIRYCETWEEWPLLGHLAPLPIPSSYPPSSVSETGGSEIPDFGIGFMNGIWNDFDLAMDSALYLSKLIGGYNILLAHNATHGKLADSVEYCMGARYLATDPVRQLHAMWNSYFEKSSEFARFLMVCHSQGAIHVRNALLDYPPEYAKRIEVVAIAPGGYIYQQSCAQVTHYRNGSPLRDPVGYLDWKGAKREKETIVELRSHPSAKSFDHEFQSPSYKRVLGDRLREFLSGAGW
ncbi:MAG: putative deoxyribonuclease RhsA [Chlamydiae bacterium]|nr:putative deoxyribonuclease RhsA [Chlamydiota bacterium]